MIGKPQKGGRMNEECAWKSQQHGNLEEKLVCEVEFRSKRKS